MTQFLALVQSGETITSRSRFEPFRSILIVVSCSLVTLSVFGALLVFSTYSAGDARVAARTPRLLELHPSEVGAFFWVDTLDQVTSEYPVAVVYLAVIDPRTSPPPGIDSWPAPGMVYLSPGVVSRLAVGDGAQTRWGQVAGVISRSGLVDDDEGLIYVGAGGALSSVNAQVASGFGTKHGPTFGAMLYRKPVWMPITLVFSFMVAPASWLLLTAVKLGASIRRRREQVFRLFGATTGQLFVLRLGESWRPIAIGVGIATAVMVTVSRIDLVIPGLGFTNRASDIQVFTPLILVHILCSLLFYLGFFSSGLSTAGESRIGEERRSRSAKWWVPLVVAATTVIAQNLAVGFNRYEAVFFILVLGTIGTVVSVVLSAPGVIRQVGLLARRHTEAGHGAGSLVGGAQIAARPRPAARLVSTCIVLMIVATMVADLTTLVTSEQISAANVRDKLGNSIATITPRVNLSEEDWHRGIDILRAEYALVSVVFDSNFAVTVTGSDLDLKTLGLDSESRRMPEWLFYVTGNSHDVDVRAGGVSRGSGEDWQRIVVGERSGAPLDIERLRTIVSESTIPQWSVEAPGDSWYTGAFIAAAQAQWVLWFGSVGLAVSLIALWANYTSEMLRTTYSLRVTNVIAPSRRFIRQAVAWRVAIPVLGAATGGALLTTILAIKPQGTGPISLPINFIIMSAGLICVSGVLAWWVVSRKTERAAQQFTVGVAEE